MDVIENLAEVKFQTYILNSQDDKRDKSQSSAGCRSQRDLPSAGGTGQCVRSALDSPRVDLEMGRSPHYQAIWCKEV